MVNTLENRFPLPKELPRNVDGVIALGGVVNVATTQDRGQMSINGNVERIVALGDLSRQYPEAKLVFTSGSGVLGRPDLKEAAVAKPLLERLIFDPERLVLENESRNTYENAVLSKELVAPQKGEVWIMITSASHMPRAVGIFRKLDWDVIPYPVDYTTPTYPDFAIGTNARSGLGRFRQGLHEWLGLFVYYWTGKTSELFPGPQPAP